MNKEVLESFTVGERLDKVLATAYPEHSRSSLEKLIENGLVHINGAPAKSNYRVKTNDTIEIDFSPFQIQVSKIEIPILYEDDNVIVLDKPAGILTHSKGTFNAEATVASFILPKLNGSKEWMESNRAGIVHRLDRGTSGVILCAKTEIAQSFMQKQFAKRNVKKTYLATIVGELPEPHGLIDVPIERNPKKPSTFRAGVNGKSAQTEYQVLSYDGTKSIVELKPTTGRTHQLRVHLAYLKHPIIGDVVYGGQAADRLMLHAVKLEVTLPSKDRKIFSSRPPATFGV